MIDDRDEAMLERAFDLAMQSPNRSRKTAAVIHIGDMVLSESCNTFPGGVADLPERHEGESRYKWIEHAERLAVFGAARRGAATEGASMTTLWYPCSECARAIVGSGIAELCCSVPDLSDDRWGSDFVVAAQILEEGGVRLRYHDRGPILPEAVSVPPGKW